MIILLTVGAIKMQINECLELLYQAFYMDDGVSAGRRSALLWALFLIKEIWLFNIGKSEPFCKNDVSTCMHT